ncbi:MAG: GrpB family protein [Staphylococcus epidermidis]|nr:GrpB family protein [Staphylococcus epidermidis]
MYANVQPFIKNESVKQFTYEYNKVKDVLFTILDSPIKYTQHIGGTCHFNYQTEPILDILVGVNNLHDITSLDEKRLNYAGFYRLHHSYKNEYESQKQNLFEKLYKESNLLS